MVIICEFGNLLNFGLSINKSLENLFDVGSWLHGYDSKLVLFIDPNEESLVIIVVDASVLWPVSVETTSVKESVSFFKQEMVIDKLLSVLWGEGI
jgi:hypothetical protein